MTRVCTYTVGHNIFGSFHNTVCIRLEVGPGCDFSDTGQENPTGSVVLDFSVWYCLSGTALPVR